MLTGDMALRIVLYSDPMKTPVLPWYSEEVKTVRTRQQQRGHYTGTRNTKGLEHGTETTPHHICNQLRPPNWHHPPIPQPIKQKIG